MSGDDLTGGLTDEMFSYEILSATSVDPLVESMVGTRVIVIFDSGGSWVTGVLDDVTAQFLAVVDGVNDSGDRVDRVLIAVTAVSSIEPRPERAAPLATVQPLAPRAADPIDGAPNLWFNGDVNGLRGR